MSWRIAVAIAVVALARTAATAQPAPDPADAAYREGRRLYDLREWDQAIAKFKEAYKRRPDAPSLFNIAQSYRLKGDCVEALSFYRTYKRNYPAAENIAKVDAFITELEPCAKERAAQPAPAPPAPAPTATAPPPVDTSPAPEAPRRTRRGLRIAGLATAGAGALAIGTGFYFASRARAKANEVEDRAGMDAVWDPDLQASGKRANLTAIVLWSVGGAAIAGGAVMYVLGRRAIDDDPPTAVGVQPLPGGGATVVWSGAL